MGSSDLSLGSLLVKLVSMQNILLTLPGKPAVSMSFDALLSQSPKTLLFFYPKDNTPGCTLEGQDFTRLMPQFADL